MKKPVGKFVVERVGVKKGNPVLSREQFSVDRIESLAAKVLEIAGFEKITIPPRVCREFARMALSEGTGRHSVEFGNKKYSVVFLSDRFYNLEVYEKE